MQLAGNGLYMKSRRFQGTKLSVKHKA